MKEYTTQNLRNIALVSHSGAGKTILAESLLLKTGAINRLGTIDDGTTISDFDEEEQRRQLSLSTSIIPIEYKDHKVNVLDTPGYPDFVGEVISALSVADGAVVLVDSAAGAEVGTEIGWNYCDEFNLPRFVLVNRMGKDTANFQQAIASVQELTEKRLIPAQLPWGEGEDFKGIINLLNMKAHPKGGEAPVDIPDELADDAEAARMELIEAAAEGADELLEKYLEGEELSEEEIMQGLQRVVREAIFVPVFTADATDDAGLGQLLDAFLSLTPAPTERSQPFTAQGPQGEEELSSEDSGPLAAYVWKTTADPFVGKITYFRVMSGVVTADGRLWNQNKETEERIGNLNVMRGKEQIGIKTAHAGDIVAVPKLGETQTGDTLCDKGHPLTLMMPEFPNALYRVAVTPKTQADATKMGETLSRLAEEDMTLSWYNDGTTRQTILQGMGTQHIDVAIRKAEGKFQVGLDTTQPRIPYKETITRNAESQYRHKKQSGGSGQFGEVFMRVEPLEEENFEFVSEVFGGAISQNYLPAIEKGVKGVMQDGVIAGYPVFNVKVAITDGKEHPVDSKPVAFEIAGREAFKLGIQGAGPVLLEPIMEVSVTVPEPSMGDVIGDLNTRRARVQGMDSVGGRSVVSAHVPLAEMLNYTSDLRSITGGRGVFTMKESHYEQVPPHLADEIIAESKKAKTEEE